VIGEYLRWIERERESFWPFRTCRHWHLWNPELDADGDHASLFPEVPFSAPFPPEWFLGRPLVTLYRRVIPLPHELDLCCQKTGVAASCAETRFGQVPMFLVPLFSSPCSREGLWRVKLVNHKPWQAGVRSSEPTVGAICKWRALYSEAGHMQDTVDNSFNTTNVKGNSSGCVSDKVFGSRTSWPSFILRNSTISNGIASGKGHALPGSGFRARRARREEV